MNPPVAPTPPDSPFSMPLCVLLVEDEPGARFVVADYLRSCGCQVVEAADSADARRLADELASPPDVLLLDVTLPGGGGVRLAAELAARLGPLPTVFVSGLERADVALPDRAVFLRKPFRLAALVAAIVEAFAGHLR